jgi:hypothetical protein
MISAHLPSNNIQFMATFFSFFGILGFELRTLHLQGRCCTTEAHLQLFLHYFGDNVSLFVQASLNHDPFILFYTSHDSWDDRHAPPHTAFCL